jgi:CubicO group peptidase (beta-lactamase class C family)
MFPFSPKIANHSLIGASLLLFATAQCFSADSKPDVPVSQPAPATSGTGIASIIQRFVDHHAIAGAVLLVATKDKVLTFQAVGFSDLKTNKPMATDDLFEIASMSKPIAATAVMMLVDEGKVHLDDPVEKYLPEFAGQMAIAEKDANHMVLKKPNQPLLVRHLLTHTSGILYSGPLEKPSLDRLPLRMVIAQHAMLPLQFEPGSKFMYSNGGIATAARIVEVVSGEPYEKFLQDRLFTPLGMRDTTFWPTKAQLTRLAKCYKANAAGTGLIESPLDYRFSFPLNDTIHRYAMPGIGLFSTAGDMLKFCRMYLNGGVYAGKRYLSATSIALMTKRETPNNVKPSYGFGWSIDPEGSYSHGGSFNTGMRIFPKLNLISIFMSQCTSPMVKEGKKANPAFEAAVRKFALAPR